MKTSYLILLIICIITACDTKKKTEQIDETSSAATDTLKTTLSNEENSDLANVDEEPIEDEMKFMPPIENDGYFGIVIGNNISDHLNNLSPGELQTGEGVFDVHFIMYKVDTLGYVFGNEKVESIHIWDPRGATHKGIRVGTTISELKDFLKEPVVHGSEMEARVHVFNEKHMYRLNYHSMDYDLDFMKIPDSVSVTEIIITK